MCVPSMNFSSFYIYSIAGDIACLLIYMQEQGVSTKQTELTPCIIFCRYNYYVSLTFQIDAPVVSDCLDGDIQLVGGPTPQEGTVQICANSVWGSVCHRSWNTPDANVACFQLGYQPVGKSLNYIGDHILHNSD